MKYQWLRRCHRHQAAALTLRNPFRIFNGKHNSGRRGTARGFQNQGIDYSTTEQLVSELFDDEHFPQKIRTFQDEEPVDVIRSYIYIISKVVDGRTFIKIGMSNFEARQKLATRLESAQTFLIPGLENGGFKLHNIFFYRREAKHVASTPFAQLVEQGLHKN